MSFVVRIFVFALIALSVSADAPAQSAGGTSNVPYVGLEAGVALSSAEIGTFNNGVRSACDLHYAGEDGIRPTDVSSFAALLTGDCAFPGSTWTNDFDSSIGRTIGVTGGVSKIGGLPFRAEFEYLYRNNGFEGRSESVFGGEKLAEFNPEFGGQIYGELADVISHSAFANIYYDFHLAVLNSSLTPYIGFGVGWSKTKFDLLHFFQRNDGDGVANGTGDNAGHPATRNLDADGNCTPVATDDCVLETLEGTVSYARETHDDSTVGFQVLVGMDYDLTEKVSVGFKLRWAYFGDIESDDSRWDALRGHGSTVAPTDTAGLENLGRPNDILYRSTLTGDQIFGAAVSVKYRFF